MEGGDVETRSANPQRDNLQKSVRKSINQPSLKKSIRTGTNVEWAANKVKVDSKYYFFVVRGVRKNNNLVPRIFHLPTPMERGKKDPGSGWSRDLVTNLSSWEGFQFIKLLSPLLFVTSYYKLAPWATMENSLSISQRRFVISSTLLSTFESKPYLEAVKR